MNREILFKAKRKDNGEWVEGLPTRMWGTLHIQDSDDENTAYEINPDTLCQYTGMNDNTEWKNLTETEKESFLSNWNYKENRKNKIEDWEGKRIWENDICDRKEKYPEIVTYNKGDWQLDYSYVFGNGMHTDACNLGFYVCERNCVEVIGNIFDNADLLEVE